MKKEEPVVSEQLVYISQEKCLQMSTLKHSETHNKLWLVTWHLPVNKFDKIIQIIEMEMWPIWFDF